MPTPPIVDADGHVYENDREIFEHLEPPFRGRQTLLGFPFWPSIDGFQRGAIHAHMGLHASFESSAPIWLEFLDKTSIAATVLYPTAGLAHSLIRDPEWAIALARGYNDWIAARYTRASARIRAVALFRCRTRSQPRPSCAARWSIWASSVECFRRSVCGGRSAARSTTRSTPRRSVSTFRSRCTAVRPSS